MFNPAQTLDTIRRTTVGNTLFPKPSASTSRDRIITGAALFISCTAALYEISPVALSVGRPSLLSILSTVLLALYAHVRYYLHPLHLDEGRSKAWQVAAAAVFSLLVVLGQSLEASRGVAIWLESPLNAALLAWRIIGFGLLAFSILGILTDLVTSLRYLPMMLTKGSLFGRNIGGPATFAIIFVCWSIYLLVFFPGAITTDTSRQLAQYFGANGLALTNHFPFFTSLFYGPIYQFGLLLSPDGIASVMLLSLFQITLGASVFTAVIVWIQRLGTSRWIWLGSLIFCSLFPLLPAHAVTISKDFLHACCTVLFILQLVIAYRFRSSTTPLIASAPALIASCLLVSLTRNNGVFFAVPALFVLCAATKRLRYAGATVVTIICFLSWQNLALPAIGVAPSEKREMLSAPMQIIARGYSNGISPSEEDEELLRNALVVEPSSLGQSYDPVIADPTKGALREDSMFDTAGIVRVALHVFAQDPLEGASALLTTTLGFWYPFDLGSYWTSEATPYYPENDTPYAEIASWFAGSDWSDSWTQEHSLPIRLLQSAWFHVPIIKFLYRPGTYCWLMIFLLYYALSVKSRRALTMIVLVPLVLLYCTLLAGPCSSLRYALPAIYSLPIILWVLCSPFSSTFQKEKGDHAPALQM